MVPVRCVVKRRATPIGLTVDRIVTVVGDLQLVGGLQVRVLPEELFFLTVYEYPQKSGSRKPAARDRNPRIPERGLNAVNEMVRRFDQPEVG